MKKIVPVALIIVLILVGGYFFFSQKSGLQKKPEIMSKKEKESKKSNVITSIKDAIMKKMSLKCEYPDEQGNTVTSYIKGEMMRVMGYKTGNQQDESQMLMRDEKIYIWNEQTKKGTVMSLNKKMMEQDEVAKTTPAVDQKTQTIEEIEKYKDYCKVITIPSSIFAVPTDVQFTDFDQQMKEAGIDVQKMMEQYKISSEPLGGK